VGLRLPFFQKSQENGKPFFFNGLPQSGRDIDF